MKRASNSDVWKKSGERGTATSAPNEHSVMPRRGVEIIRKRAEHLGTVEAPNEKAAIEKAAETFHIPQERRNRFNAHTQQLVTILLVSVLLARRPIRAVGHIAVLLPRIAVVVVRHVAVALVGSAV